VALLSVVCLFPFFCSFVQDIRSGVPEKFLARQALDSEVLFDRMGSVRVVLLLIGRRIQRFV